MQISEADYRLIMDAHQRGDLVIMIDTASFRQLLVRSDATKFSDLIGEAVHTRIGLIRILTYAESALPVAAIVLSFVAMRWWGLLVAPIVFVGWSGYKVIASRGVQRITPASLILAIGVLGAALVPGLDMWHRVLFVVLAGTVFMTRFLYVSTASVVFGLIHSNYQFFKHFFMQPEGAIVPLIWTDPEWSGFGRERDGESSPETAMPEFGVAGDASETNVHKGLIEKAKDAPISFRILMETLKHSLQRENPSLSQCPRWNDFVMAATVGGCTSLAIRLHFDVDENQRTPLELSMRQVLEERFPDSEVAYVECYRFVTESLGEIPRPERGKYLFLLIAMWVMGVVTAGGKIDRQDYIMARIAEFYQNETAGFWNQPKVG